MAVITLDVDINSNKVLRGIKEINNAIPKGITVAVDADPTKAIKKIKDLNEMASQVEKYINKSKSGLASSINDWDRAINTLEADSKKFSDALQAQMQAEEDARKSHTGMASSMTVIDQAIQASEAASKAFSDQLRRQMEEEEATRVATDGLLSSMNAYDQAIYLNEQRGKSFSDQLRRQMEAEEENARAAEQNTTAHNALAVALGNIAARAFHLVISKITQALREAVSTMKDVDTQLTNISKVSGITGQALADMGERAYETASKYGVSADEFLSSVYTFQKAGLGESAEAMGELAVKTMLVGDTTADVASKFLISANAAWKFGGDMERLSQIVDEADYINNNYATDLQKLSDGLPRVASVAAQAGMSAEETLAAIGTISAVTQESGQKSSTALRALILNIEGQVGEFVDETGESFEVTEESVKSLQGLMEKYAKAELDAARASGELINPMTAIKALFEGMANSDLNDQDLFALLSGMGGKLRTNQLTALVQNYELFGEMLDKIADSAGTADNEISLMMDSWERKAQVLKNNWTELVANIVSTDTVKGAITTLTELIDSINDGFISAAERTAAAYSDANKELEDLRSRSESLTDIEKRRLEYLESQVTALKEQADEEEKAAARATQRRLTSTQYSYYNEQGTRVAKYGAAGDTASLYNMRGEYRDTSVLASQGDLQGYKEGLNEIIKSYQSIYDQIIQVRTAGEELTANQQQFVREFEDLQTVYESNIVSIKDLGNGYDALIDKNGEVVAYVENYEQANKRVEDTEKAVQEELDQLIPGVEEAKLEAQGFADMFKTAATNIGEVQAALEGLTFPNWPGFASGTKNAPGGPTLVNELGPELISENGKAYIANGGAPAVVNLSRGAIVLTAEETKTALKGGMPIHAAAAGAFMGDFGGIIGSITSPGVSAGSKSSTVDHGTDTFGAWQCKACGSWNLGNEKKCTACGTPKGQKSKSKGRGSSAPAKSLEELVKEFNDLLSNLDKQAKLANNQGDYAKEAELYEKAQEAIKKMVDEYRKAGYADDSDEILDLLNKNYDYANKQLTLYQTKWDDLIKALDADTAAQDAANKLAEKQQAVEDAREALANAQRQRTTRIYNAATGQWEWVADQKSVSSAQKNLESAEKNYADEVKSQALAELKAMRDTVTDLNDVILGPALSAVVTMAQDSAEFQNFARALNAVFGVGTFLNSTDGNPNAIATTDSHDVIYTFGNVTLTADQAANMSVAELAKMLSVLKLTS